MLSIKEFLEPDNNSLAEYLPWAFLRAPGIVENKDGSLQKSYRFRGQDLDSATKRELMGVSGAFNNAFKRLPDGWALFIEAQRNQAKTYLESSWPNEASRLIDQERQRLLSKCNDNFSNTYFLTLVYREARNLDNKGKSWFVKKNKQNISEYDSLSIFQKTIAELEELLSGIFTVFQALNDDETLTYLHSCISNKRHVIKTPEIPMYLDHILCDSSVEHGLGLRLAEQTIKTITVKSFPMESFPCILDALNDLNFPFRWSTRFIFMGHEKANAYLSKMRRSWYANRKKLLTVLQEVASQSESGISESSALDKSTDADDALKILDQGLVSFGHFTATLNVWHENEAIANSRILNASSMINRLGFACQQETINALDAWLSSIPGVTYANVRKPIVHTLNLAHMAPLSAVWTGETENKHLGGPPHFIAKTRGNAPFCCSTNVGDVGHTLIFGPTGSGKSTLLSFMAIQWLRYEDAQVFIFDKGSSSRVVTESVSGSFYNIGAKESDFCFQPLKNIDSDNELVWANEWVLEILTDQGLKIDTENKTEVWQALLSLSEQEQSTRTLGVFRSLVQSAEIRQALTPFCLDGPYGYLFDGIDEANDNNCWQVFEMAELFEKKNATKPALSYLFHRLSKRFNGNPTLLILDEAWLFLEDSIFAKRIKQWLKELRKARVYVIFATQSLSDAMQSSIAMALQESCPTKIFLPNTSAQDEISAKFYKRIGLNNRQIETISQAIPKKEYYLCSPLGCRLFDLALGPLALSLCASSSIEDQKLVLAIKNKFGQANFLKEFVRVKGGNNEDAKAFDFILNSSFN
ncbi:MAG: conjugal transfer protein TrbE [Myxococcales bacterium]|nr:conjugal transfer protein TrbE [Myxococcales bacterium]